MVFHLDFASDHTLLAFALSRGIARVDPWGDGKRCELAVGGLLYATHFDDFGLPTLTDVERQKLREKIADAEAAVAADRERV